MAYKHSHLFLTDLEAKKSKVMVLADSVSGVGLLPDSPLFAATSHGGRRAMDLSGVSPIHEGTAFIT